MSTYASSFDVDSVHKGYMDVALLEARKSPPKPTNFCVGAVLVIPDTVPITGYTLELEGNTHAEQCCFIKAAQKYNTTESQLGEHLPEGTVLYTTMEPCNQRSAGNKTCVERILGLKMREGRQAIRQVYVGVWEPETFVGVNEGRKRLEDAGIQVVHVGGFEEEIMATATAGHVK